MLSFLPRRFIRLHHTLLSLSLFAVLSACNAGQDKSPDGKPTNHDPNFTPTAGKTTTSMPLVIIRNIREDRAGNIWFATFGGPIRYDGKHFTNFAEEVGLAKTRIFSLAESRSGALWFGSITGGASRYDGKSFTKFTDKDGLGSNDVTWIFEDRDANIWFGTGNGASRYDDKTMTNFTTKDGLVHNSVYAIAQDATGRIWFGTQGGICSYDGKSFSNLEDKVSRSFANIRAVVVDRSGNLWFGGQGGAFRYDGKTLTTFTSENGLLADFVGSIIVDRTGNLWLGHPGHGPQGGGASRYDGKSFKHFTHKDGLCCKTVYALFEDKSGNIWFGSIDAGVCRFDGKNFTHFSATNSPSLPAKPEQQSANDGKSTAAKGEIVTEMAKDLGHVFQAKDGHHWFLSGSEGAFRYDGKTITRFTKKDGLAGDGVGGVQEDKSGNLYFSTNGGISKFDGRSFTTLEQPKATGEWKNQPDDLWFPAGQDTGAVFRYDGKSLHRLAFPKTKAGDAATLPRDKFPNAKFSPYDVYTIFKDSKGHLWFGTAVLGACRYDGKSFTWIPEEELRNANFGLRSIIEDKDGKFWFSKTLHRYAIDRTAAAGSSWYRKEKGIGDLSGIKEENYEAFMSSVIGDDGAMWMAILGGAVYRYDGKSITPFHIKENGKHHWIFSIYKDRQGVLWVGTQAHGVYRFNGKSFEKFKP